MRLSATLLALVTAASLAACGGSSSSNSSDASSAPAASAAASSDASPAAAGGGSSATSTDIPDYPGATKVGSGSAGAGSGTVETTDDAASKVADFYKGKLSGAKMTSVKGPTGDMTVFTMGDMTSGSYSTVTISAAGGKTSIAIATVKKQ